MEIKIKCLVRRQLPYGFQGEKNQDGEVVEIPLCVWQEEMLLSWWGCADHL